MKSSKIKIAIGCGIIIIALVFLIYNGIKGSAVYYLSVSELIKEAANFDGEGIRVSGKVMKNSIEKDEDPLKIRFVIFDKLSGAKIFVNYRGVVPDTFNDEADVLVEGEYNLRDNMLKATTIFTKCPSKYEPASNDSSVL